MQPVRPKMKKMILTGFVACMSLFGLSSGAPVPRSTHSAKAQTTTAATLPPSSSSPSHGSAPATHSSSASSSPSRRGTRSASVPTAPPVAPPRPSSFSLGLSLGPIDYAAAGIARRVSRIFVRRMSAQSAQVPHVDAENKPEANMDSQEAHGSEGSNLIPVIESEPSLDSEDSERRVLLVDKEADEHVPDNGTDMQIQDQDETGPEGTVSPELRACRWACF